MASERISELLRPATKGDHQAMEALMNLGENYMKEGDLVNAACAFKEAAISYRIDASRQAGKHVHEQGTSDWRLEVIQTIFIPWLEANANTIRSTRPEILSIPEARLIHMLRSEAEFPDIQTLRRYLERTLESMGYEFVVAGGNPLRAILSLLTAFGGQRAEWAAPYLRDVRIRVGLDQLAEKLISASRRESN